MSTAELFGTGSFPASTEEPAAGHSRAEAFCNTIIMTVKSHQKKKKKEPNPKNKYELTGWTFLNQDN